jgi:phosphate transport system substrate-binding protein
MRLSIDALCIALLASSATAQDLHTDRSLPRYRPVAGVVGVIAGHSSAAMNELMTMWGAEYKRIYPSVRVELDDAGFETAGDGAATFGPWLSVIREPTVSRFKRRFGYAAMEIPVCLRVLAVFARPDNPYEGGLSMQEVETIFSAHFSNVTWGDLGCGAEWARRSINLHAPRLHVNTLLRRHFDQLFVLKESVERYSDDAAVVAAVSEDAGGLGLASIGCKTDKVRALAILPKGGSEFVPATAENARDDSYPLTDTFYLVLNHDADGDFALDPPRREFLRYILSKEGQQAVVQAGHVALSAEQAEQALAHFGIRPTGTGSWDEMVSLLRARGLPRIELTKIEHLVRRIGDRPTDEQLADLSNGLARTKLTSSVMVATDESGGIVKCRLFGQPKSALTLDQATGAEATIPIGLYTIWTERDGKATSPTDAWFHVVREQERIKIYETRETIQRPTDGVPERR